VSEEAGYSIEFVVTEEEPKEFDILVKIDPNVDGN
jgi:hypothetical protein